MSYIGNTPNFQQFAVQTEDGNAASYALDYTPGSATAILVFVDGVHQKPTTDYTVSGATLTPVALWPAGTGNVLILFLGRAADVPTPADNSVTTAKIVDGAVTHAKRTYNAGQVIQSVYAEYTTSTTFTTVLPSDDTIPQNTEGSEILTASITPKSATNKLRVRLQGTGAREGSTNHICAALFRDSTANAVAAMLVNATSDVVAPLALEHEEVAGSVSATTFKVRVGPNSAGTLRINGAGARIFGGVAKVTLVVEEIAV